MEMKKIIAVIIAGTVCALIFGALLPVWADTTASEDTFTNAGYNRYTSIKSDSEETITISWDHTDPHNITVNDVVIPLAIMTQHTSIVFGQDFTFRCINIANYATIQLIGYNNSTFLQVSTEGTTDLSITATGGTLTATAGDTTKTTTYTTLYYPALDGYYIMKDANTPAYVLEDSSLIIANGVTQIGGVGVGVYFTGNIEDGYSFAFYRDTDASADNVVSNYSEVNGYNDLLSLSTISFDLTNNSVTSGATYSYFLVPYEVTAERTVHMSGALATLVNIIPLLIAFGLIIGIAGVVIYKRM